MNILYATLLMLAAVVDLLAIGAIWADSKPLPYLRWLRYFLLALAVWGFTYALFWLSDVPETRYWLLNATYLGVVFAPPAYFLFSVYYTGKGPVPSKRIAFLLGIGCLLLLLMWTDHWHGLFFGGQRQLTDSVLFDGGVFFWVNVFYGYGQILVASGLLLQHSFALQKKMYRRQAFLLMFGTLLPVVVNIGLVLGWLPRLEIDLTPLLFTLTGLTILYSLERYALGRLRPIGYQMLMEHMESAFLLLDTGFRVMEYNRAASNFLRQFGKDQIGASLSTILAELPEEVRVMLQTRRGEAVVPWEGGRYIKVRALPIREPGTDLDLGVMCMWHDVTEEVRRAQTLAKSNRALEEEIARHLQTRSLLEHLATHDGLTGLFNRHYLDRQLPDLLRQAAARGESVALCLLDVDHFKLINDRYGHASGDDVLRQLSAYLQRNVRKQDWLARYGGEEIVIAMPGLQLNDAAARMAALRAGISGLVFQSKDGEIFSVTVSMGLAVFPQHARQTEPLLHCADDALYTAKRNGRNRLEIFGEGTDRSHHTWEQAK